MKQFWKKYGHAWILGYFFIYLPWFLYLEKTVKNNYHVMHSELDDLIPFEECFIIPYLLWFVYVAAVVVYLFFSSREDYYRCCTFLFTGMTLCLLVCTLFPNGTDFRPVVDPEKNVFCWLVSLIHKADTCTNVFPSVHVYNSLGAHIAVTHSETLGKNKWIRGGSFVLMVSICLSTVFLKQHSVIDVVGASFLAAAIYPLAYAGTASAREVQKSRPQFIRW